MKNDFIKTKKFKVLAVLTSIVAVLVTMVGVGSMRDKTDAVNLESPFYSNEMGDNMFTVSGYGDLFVNIIRKQDGTGTGPLAFCLNKQKLFPTNDSILYQSIENDTWTWELDNTRTPSAAQVEQVQRALYAYKYVFPEKLTSYGLDAENTMALYHAQQITQWAILENWTPDKVQIKEDVKTKPQMLAYAQSVHALFSDMLAYAQNGNNSTYTDGIKVVYTNTDTAANYTYQSTDYITTNEGRGYFRSSLMQALPRQKAGYYYEGNYGFTYEVTLEGAPEGSRIVNEYGVPQTTFSTKSGVGLNFYVDIPLEGVAGQSGNFKVNVKTTVFRRNAGILWRPVTETAYQTLLQNASIPDNATQSVTLSYGGIAKATQVSVLKEGEQLNSFTATETEYGTVNKPTYKMLPLSGTKYTIEIMNKTGDYFIFGTDGNPYVDGQNLIQKGNVVTGSDGIAQFNQVPLDANRDMTSFKIIETVPTNGYIIGSNNSKVVELNKASSDTIVKGNATFKNERVNVYFEVNKLKEVIKNDKTKEVGTTAMEGAVFGIYTNEPITSVDGTTLEKDSLIGIVKSDKNGKVNSSAIDLPLGYTFTVKELATDDTLALSTDIYYLDTNITTSADDTQTTRKINLTDKNGNIVSEITNHLKKGSFTIEKQIESLNDEAKSIYTTITDGNGFTFDIFTDKEATNKIATLTASDFENGKFLLENLTPGTYYVKETAALDGYEVTNKIYSVEVKALEVANVVIQNNLKENTHTLVKYDITSGERKAFAGVTFDIKYKDTIVKSATTKADGKISFTLKNGIAYQLVERVPAGYEKISAEDITIIGGQDTKKEIVVENKEIKILGSIIITKEDAISKKALENVSFALYRASDINFEAALAEDVTDEFGNITFDNLAPDTYVIVETNPLTGYLKTENTVVDLTKIKNNETVFVTIENTKYYGAIEVTKVDADTKEKLPKAVLGLYANESSKTPIATAETNKDGLVVFDNVPYGMYYIGEISQPAGYELTDKRILVDLTDMTKDKVSIEFTNRAIHGNIEVIKRDTDTDELLKNAVFKLYESENGKKGSYVTTLTTDKDGYAYYEGIYQKDYVLEEVSAPLGYIISNGLIVIDGSKLNQGQTIRVTAYNKKQEVVAPKGNITIHKIDMDTKEEINATFVLLDASGKIIETKETINGYATFENLPIGEYSVIEKIASAGYSVNTTIHKVTLTELNLNQTVLVENKKQEVVLEEATITVYKYDKETEKPLSGVEFKVYKKGSDEVYAIMTTDENGKAVITDLQDGVYTVVESRPLDGYVHSDIQHQVEINEENRSGVISVYNEKEVIEPEVPEEPDTPAEPEVPEEPDTPTEPETPEIPDDIKQPEIEIPETGIDGSISPVFIGGAIMIFASFAGFIYLGIKRLKERNK